MIKKNDFIGIPHTSPFTIQVVQRGQSASGEIDNWGEAENPWGEPTPGVTAAVRLVKRSNLQCAPEGMIFEVDLAGFDTPGPIDPDAYDPQYHNLYYFWDFGDVGSRFTAPENVMEHQRNANKGYGPVVSHVYDTPGEKTVQVMIIEPSSGKVAQAVFAIGGASADTPEIKDPAALFPTNRTFIVDSTGYGSAAYPGAVIYPTINAAVSALARKADPHRIVVRDGQTFTTTNNLGFGASVPSCHIVREGGGTRPKIYAGHGQRMFQFSNFDASNTKDFLIDGIDLIGPWDNTTETGVGSRSCFEQSTDQGSYFVLHNCTTIGFAHTYVALQYANNLGVRIFSNTAVEGNRVFPFYEVMGAPVAYLGMKISLGENALVGGQKNGRHNGDSACIRFQSARNVVMDGCDLYNHTGWFENYFGIQTPQSAIRFDQRVNRGTKMNMQRCSVEGDLYLGRMNNSVQTNVQNNLIERCILVALPFNRRLISIERGGCTIRNNFMLHTNSPRISFYGLFSPTYFTQTVLHSDAAAQEGNMAESAAGPIKIYNNTCVSLMDAVNGNPIRGINYEVTPGAYDSLIVENNVVHGPNHATPIVGDGPFDTTPLWKPRYIGYRSAYERIEAALPTPVASGGSITVTYLANRGAADYAGNIADDPHRIAMGGPKNVTAIQNVMVTFDDTTFTVTNGSTKTWPAGPVVLVLFCPTSPKLLSQYATSASMLSLYQPAEGSPALGTADEDFCAVGDFFGNFRPAYPSKGALEAVI